VRLRSSKASQTVLRYLPQHGSNIKVLDISQYLTDYSLPTSVPDNEGQVYPWYTYIKCNAQDELGNSLVVAMPADPAYEFPGIQMFHHQMGTWPVAPWGLDVFMET
jgi:hypothetical protein